MLNKMNWKKTERGAGKRIVSIVIATLVLISVLIVLTSTTVKAATLPTLSVKIHRILQLDEIDSGSQADWYYHVGVEQGTTWDWRTSSVHSEADDWTVDATHTFSISSTSVFVAITLCESDTSYDDWADISSTDTADGGNDASNSPIPAGYYLGSYRGTYNLITNVLTGDTTQADGSYLKTSGAFDSGTGTNDASVWFSISDNYASPTASAGTDKTAFKGEVVNFDGSLSAGSTGSSIESYKWDFENDGSWDASTILTSHTYTAKGAYTAKLQITDSIGQTSTDTCTVTIKTKDPVAVFSWTPTNPSTSDTVTFTDSSSDPDGVIVSWSWNFGDTHTASVMNPTHTYSIAGTFSVQLTVTDDDGATNVKTSSITITAAVTITATISPNHTSGTAPLSVTFTSTVSGGLAPYTYSWAFGDSGDSTQSSPSHTFTSSGTYTVTLTVQDSSPVPKTDSATTTIIVTSGSGGDGDATSDSTDWTPIIIIVIIVIIAVVGIAAALSMRKPKQPPMYNQPPQQYPQQPPQYQQPPNYPPPPPPQNP